MKVLRKMHSIHIGCKRCFSTLEVEASDVFGSTGRKNKEGSWDIVHPTVFCPVCTNGHSYFPLHIEDKEFRKLGIDRYQLPDVTEWLAKKELDQPRNLG